MDSKKATALLCKYWENKTSLREEAELKNYFRLRENLELPEAGYFNYLQKKRTENPLGDQFEKEILEKINPVQNITTPNKKKINYWLAAASLFAIVSISIIFKNEIIQVKQPAQVAEVDTYDDPEKAFEETKRALLLISSRLNGPNEYTSEFAKFEKSQNTIKQN